MTPEEVATLLQQYGSNLSQDEYDDASEPAGALEGRVARLGAVLSACQEAWAARSDDLELLAQKLGDGSRDVAWRLPLGQSGILDLFLGILAEDGLSQGLKVHSLRLVGNSCADADENRGRVVADNRLNSVIRQLSDESLIPFTIPVLYNIMVDYEPAQKLGSQSRLSGKLIALLSSPGLSDYAAFVPYFCKILALLIAQEGEASIADPATVELLLQLATGSPFKEDIDDFVSLTAVAAAYLASSGFQSRIILSNQMAVFMNAFVHAHAGLSLDQLDDQDTAAQVKQLRTSLLTALADLSGHDAFSQLHPMSSPVPQTFLAWIQGGTPSLQAAGCLALGNLARSDEVSIGLVQQDQVHIPLIKLLSDTATTDPQLIHSALSFLKNLAIPLQNKPLLGGLLDSSCVPRIYSMDTLPQVQFAAVSLTRLLLVNCPQNVRRICTPLSADPASPNHERTSVSNLVALFDRSDAEPTRLEASRAVAALCRVLHSTSPLSDVLPDWEETSFVAEEDSQPTAPSALDHPSQTNDEKRRSQFYQRHVLDKSLAFLLTQQKWPSLRSEACFVLALMSRSRDGAAVIVNMLLVYPTMNVLMETITGRQEQGNESGDSMQIEGAPATATIEPGVSSLASGLQLEPQQVDPKQQANMAKIDRENALVLCTELLRNSAEALPPLRLSLLQDWVKEGTELVAADRARP
ncbi:Armadillo-type fold domain containing protein [Purpureocillium lavendulum]|uniref:Armadillo-type fold domain containing protein n=1 Tax=Purpureocillium lavendulum TaxID=1247861 RepID=A0AB34FLN7_9HYPO|nr:Armadillo-type fold domain containing protein [Purpureocillium lavendulum]